MAARARGALPPPWQVVQGSSAQEEQASLRGFQPSGEEAAEEKVSFLTEVFLSSGSSGIVRVLGCSHHDGTCCFCSTWATVHGYGGSFTTTQGQKGEREMEPG